MSDARFHAARALLAGGVRDRAFPAAVAEVGTADRVIWREAVGRLTYDAAAPEAAAATIFDLASLTKVLATALVAMRLADEGRFDPDARVAALLPAWRGRDREHVTARDLLTHSAGLTAYLPLYRDHAGRREFEEAICALPLEYPPRQQALYSDLGFILLGFILEDSGGAPLDRLVEPIAAEAAPEPLVYRVPRDWRPRCAPTEVDAWRGRLLVGEVHDENAWALGGVAPHAGLFGTAPAVGLVARAVLRALRGETRLVQPATLARFLERDPVPGSSRALGWDTMLPTSSCGTRMSAAAFGHTGFTGASLWIDPVPGVYVVLLTNRVHPSRDNQAIQAIRPAFHDAVMDALAAP